MSSEKFVKFACLAALWPLCSFAATSLGLSLSLSLSHYVTFALVRETCGKFYLPILWRAVCPKDFLPRHVARCKVISSSAAAAGEDYEMLLAKKTIKVYGT